MCLLITDNYDYSCFRSAQVVTNKLLLFRRRRFCSERCTSIHCFLPEVSSKVQKNLKSDLMMITNWVNNDFMIKPRTHFPCVCSWMNFQINRSPLSLLKSRLNNNRNNVHRKCKATNSELFTVFKLQLFTINSFINKQPAQLTENWHIREMNS